MSQATSLPRPFLTRCVELARNGAPGSDLINGLLGLLVLMPEEHLTRVPDDALTGLRGWGVGRKVVLSMGTCSCGHDQPRTLRQFVRSMRLAVTHHAIRPLQTNGTFRGMEVEDGAFKAIIGPKELRTFVNRLAETLMEGGSRRTRLGPDDYIASIRCHPFHRQGCKRARRITRSNLIPLDSRKAALRAGHRPCKVCKP